MLKIIGWILSVVAMVLIVNDVLTKRPDLTGAKKIGWILFAILLPIVAFAVYYAVYRRKMW